MLGPTTLDGKVSLFESDNSLFTADAKWMRFTMCADKYLRTKHYLEGESRDTAKNVDPR